MPPARGRNIALDVWLDKLKSDEIEDVDVAKHDRRVPPSKDDQK